MKTGERSQAERILAENLKVGLENPRLKHPWSPIHYDIAAAYAIQGNTGETLTRLEKAVDGGYSDRWIFIDPLLESIRSDPRFVAVKDKLERRLAEMRDGVTKMGLDRQLRLLQ